MAKAGLQRARTSVGQTVLARGDERAHEIAVADPPGRRLASLRRELLEKAGDIADVPDVDLVIIPVASAQAVFNPMSSTPAWSYSRSEPRIEGSSRKTGVKYERRSAASLRP